jgi:branched-chain amino acid transport system substrate-binding protein
VEPAARRHHVAVRRRLRRAEGERRPKDKAAVAKALSTLQDAIGRQGRLSPSGPVPNVVATPIIGTQWVKAKPGSKFKLDYVVTEHADDPNVPVGAKLLPYS